MQKIEGPIQDFWLHIGIKPGSEKVSFGGIVPGEHYTIIWKQGERKIDVHVTYDDPEREKERVFEISFYAMNRLLVHLNKMEDLYKIYLSGRTTTLSWIFRTIVYHLFQWIVYHSFQSKVYQ